MKNTRYLEKNQKKKIFRRNLLNEITLKHKTILTLQAELTHKENDLYNSLTWIRGKAIRYSINCSVRSYMKPIETKLARKIDILYTERDRINGVTQNPNTIITNLSSYVLSNEEHKLLRFGLSHGLATQPNEIDTFVLAEDIWSQLYRSKTLKDNPRSIERAKNSIRAFAFNLLDIEKVKSESTNRVFSSLNRAWVVL